MSWMADAWVAELGMTESRLLVSKVTNIGVGVADAMVTESRLLVSRVSDVGVAEHGVKMAGHGVLLLVLELMVGLMLLRHDVHSGLVVVSQVSCMTDMRCHLVGTRVVGASVMGTSQVLSREVAIYRLLRNVLSSHVLSGKVAIGRLLSNVRNFGSSSLVSSWVMHVSCELVMVLRERHM